MRVTTSAAADREIDALPASLVPRVIAALRGLAADPRPPGCLLLKGRRPRTWRLRVGDYRIFYQIDDAAGVVTVTGVHHRARAYRLEE